MSLGPPPLGHSNWNAIHDPSFPVPDSSPSLSLGASIVQAILSYAGESSLNKIIVLFIFPVVVAAIALGSRRVFHGIKGFYKMMFREAPRSDIEKNL
jgi:hypothetical protein